MNHKISLSYMYFFCLLIVLCPNIIYKFVFKYNFVIMTHWCMYQLAIWLKQCRTHSQTLSLKSNTSNIV